MAEFDQWAEYYDVIHRGLPGEAEYYIEEAIRRGGETLELGCGTGRVCIPMAMSGVRVTGLELSKKMLQACRRKARKVAPFKGALTLVQGDMRSFDLGKQFSFVAMAYRTFMHLLTPDDQAACLSCVRRHLAPGGLFVMNLWAARPSTVARFSGDAFWKRYRLVGRYPLARGSSVLVHHHTVRYDEFNQLMLERHRIREVDGKKRVLLEEELTLTRAWTTPREMEHLVRRCGFSIEGVWCDFFGTPLQPDSTEMIWALRGASDGVSA